MGKALFLAVLVLICFLTRANAESAEKQKAAPASPETGWSGDFSFPSGKTEKDKVVPVDWEIRSKIGTSAAEFYIKENPETKAGCLHMEADKQSGTLIYELKKFEISKYPILNWKWKAEILPSGADGRESEKDDQAIGIYVGTGSIFSKKSISYRWDTETPDGSEGTCSYGAGTIKVKWFTLRNKDDMGKGEDGWFTEERNVYEDFKTAWGFYPETVYVSISSNSQYTGTKAAADLEWIRFIADSGKNAVQPGLTK